MDLWEWECVYFIIIHRLIARGGEEMASTASYLDTVGRPTLIVRKSSVVTEHNKPMDVRYSLATSSLLMEPLLLIAVFFMLEGGEVSVCLVNHRQCKRV